MRIINRLAARLIKFSDRFFAKSRNSLLRGDILAYAESEYPREKYPTAWKDIPDDLRRPLVWDGKLLNGRDVAELAKADLNDEHVGAALTKSGGRAVLLIAILAAVVFYSAFRNIRMGFDFLTPYPDWAADAGAWMPIISWYVLTTIERVWMIASQTISAIIPLALLFPVLWFFGFGAAMSSLWNNLSAPLRVATRDSALFWKTNQMLRSMQYTTYCREVDAATGRLAHQPFIPVGRATGTLRGRGDMEAPDTNQLVGLDGESIRQHTLILGGTGSGKTRLVIRPLFGRIMSANWGPDHKIGAYVTDGKGTLWKDLVKLIPDGKEVRVIGTDDGQFGVDLTKGMSPLEISSTFKAVSGQLAGKVADDFWPESASLLLMHAATIAFALEFHKDTVAKWEEDKAIRPYSLLGIALLASDEGEATEAINRLKANAEELNKTLSEDDKESYREAFNSASWLQGTFMELAKDTRSGIVANVNVVLGKLQGARSIARRFCSGNYAHTVDVDHALKGGIVFVAVGETEHGLAGKVVTTWLKSRLYVLARRRLLSDPEACKNVSCAMFVDEFQMLATTGPDSDSTTWNWSREAGLFLIAATQSLAALKQVMGDDAMLNLVNLLRSKIVLKTEELSTIEYARQMAGEAPRGFEYENLYATFTAREKAIGNVGSAYMRLGFFGGIRPARFRPDTSHNSAYSTDYIGGGLKGGESKDAANSVSMQIRTRFEDRNRQAIVEGVSMRPKMDFDEFLLGNGLAFAIIQRAGGDRTDIIDLEIDHEIAA